MKRAPGYFSDTEREAMLVMYRNGYVTSSTSPATVTVLRCLVGLGYVLLETTDHGATFRANLTAKGRETVKAWSTPGVLH